MGSVQEASLFAFVSSAFLSFHFYLCNETNGTFCNVSLGRSGHSHNVPLSLGLDEVILLLVEILHVSDLFHFAIIF